MTALEGMMMGRLNELTRWAERLPDSAKRDSVRAHLEAAADVLNPPKSKPTRVEFTADDGG